MAEGSQAAIEGDLRAAGAPAAQPAVVVPGLLIWGGHVFVRPDARAHAGPLVGAGSMTWIACSSCKALVTREQWAATNCPGEISPSGGGR